MTGAAATLWQLGLGARRDEPGSEPMPLRYCARCFAIQYCSEECQRADWRRHRQAECGVVAVWLAAMAARGYAHLRGLSGADRAAAEAGIACEGACFVAVHLFRDAAGVEVSARHCAHEPGTTSPCQAAQTPAMGPLVSWTAPDRGVTAVVMPGAAAAPPATAAPPAPSPADRMD